MTNYERLQDKVAYGFRKYHGRCGVYINRPISPVGCIIKLLKLFFERDKTRKAFIVTNSTIESTEIRNAVKQVFTNEHISISSKNYFKDYRFINTDLFITVNIYDNSEINNVIHNISIKFYLCIFDIRDLKDKNLIKRESLMPFIQISVPTDKIIEDSIHSPVKETLIGVSLNDDNYLKYKELNDFIVKSMKIFGNFDTLDRCRAGDKVMNYSAIHVCSIVAENNGWNEYVDTSTDFGKELDDVFNPNALHERALTVYTNSKSRKTLVASAKEKFTEIAKICDNNKGKKIIIVCQDGTFASGISEYLNKMYEPTDGDYITICGEYHNELEDKVYIDRKGNTVLYKSGEKKGQPKIIGSQKQSSLAQDDFNKDYIDILAIKATSDVNLTVDCDILILTSPLFGNIYDIRRRFQKVMFRSDPVELYTLYCVNTIEQIKVNKYMETPTHEIIRDIEDFYVSN